MDRTERPDDERATAGEATVEDGATGEVAVEDEAVDDDDRSVLHVASEGESWRFSLEDLDEDGEPAEPLTPGSPEPEHVAFVLLGAAFTVFVFSRFLV
jgi:hypothetical protein